jgi:hypothetical protein
MKRKLVYPIILIVLVAGIYALAIWYAVRLGRKLDPAYVAALIGAAVSIVTSLLALLKVPIIAFLFSPELRISIFPDDQRDCHTTSLRDQVTGNLKAPAHYFRLRIENNGLSTAKNVEVSLEKVEELKDNQYELNKDFMPLRLLWSHWRNHRWELSIPPGTYRHCDLGYIVGPNDNNIACCENGTHVFWFDVMIRPNAGRSSLVPGTYRITVSAFGDNARRSKLAIILEWKGIWKETLAELYQEGLLSIDP